MLKVQRLLSLTNLLKKKSFFLFGPRATGKSSLIQQQFPCHTLPFIDLLNTEYYLRLNARPQELESIIDHYRDPDLVIIDEVQLIPALLNEVHRLIEKRQIRFLLTGSSARKLRHQHVNLLAGRAWEAQLFPLVSAELEHFNLDRYLRIGGLPSVYLSDYPEEELNAYVRTYLQQEIQLESLVRKIPAFTRFLRTAALTNGQILNFTAIASDAQIPASTIREYYHILEDTFLGFMLPAWTKSIKRKAMSSAKFYLFDIGVRNTLAQITALDPQSDLYGQAFEHFIALELRAYLSYRRMLNQPLSYWRSTYGHEADFIIGDHIAIEVKSTEHTKEKHCRGLQALQEEPMIKQFYVVSRDPTNRLENNIHFMYWKEFLHRLWSDDLVLPV